MDITVDVRSVEIKKVVIFRGGPIDIDWPINCTKPILTGWEGITGKYKPDDGSTSPTEGRACAKSEGLYFPVMPETAS